jgi:hypothetical protein
MGKEAAVASSEVKYWHFPRRLTKPTRNHKQPDQHFQIRKRIASHLTARCSPPTAWSQHSYRADRLSGLEAAGSSNGQSKLLAFPSFSSLIKDDAGICHETSKCRFLSSSSQFIISNHFLVSRDKTITFEVDTNSMRQSPSNAVVAPSVKNTLSCIELYVYYHIHNKTPLAPILSLFDPAHIMWYHAVVYN